MLPMLKGAGSRKARAFGLVTIAACTAAVVVGCGGSDSAEAPQTASGGAPSSSQAGDLVDAAAAKQIYNPRPAERCTNQPTTGQCATSDLATKRAGVTTLTAKISSQEIWLATNRQAPVCCAG